MTDQELLDLAADFDRRQEAADAGEDDDTAQAWGKAAELLRDLLA